MTRTVAELTASDAGWKYLSATVLHLAAGDVYDVYHSDQESAVVVVEGSVLMDGPSLHAQVSRTSVFSALADLVYVPPRTPIHLVAQSDCEIAIGSAPATGRHPLRLISTREMASVLRGGGPAQRQVVSSLADPLPAESLIVYEAWVPRGGWAGWPPHRHDGYDGSPYLEETYHYRFDRDPGFGYHRNVTPEENLDESVPIRDRSLVPVRSGYHLCTAGPAANMWILNFLAGSPEDRPRPPHFDEAETWINADWNKGLLTLPAVTPPPASTPTP
jgi:5-deoxy-glucuronate isomerase